MTRLRGKFLLVGACSSSISRRFSEFFFSDITLYDTKMAYSFIYLELSC